jgi:hypothetical protein
MSFLPDRIEDVDGCDSAGMTREAYRIDLPDRLFSRQACPPFPVKIFRFVIS